MATYLLRNRKSDWVETLCEALEQHGESELLNSFCSDIQDLEIIKRKHNSS